MDINSRGLQYVLWHSVFFSLTGVCIKLISVEVTIFEMLLYRSLFAVLIISLIIRPRRTELSKKQAVPTLVLRGVFGFLGVSCMFYAMATLPLAIAMVLTLTTPVFVMLFGHLSLGEGPGSKFIGPIVLMFIGLLLMIDLRFDSSTNTSLSLFSIFVGLTGSILTAIAFLAMRKALSMVSANVVVFWFSICNLTGAFIVSFNDINVPSSNDLKFILGICLLGLLSDFTKTTAYKYAAAWFVSLLSLTSILFSGLWGWLFFSEMPNMFQILGIVLIVCAISITVIYSRKPLVST